MFDRIYTVYIIYIDLSRRQKTEIVSTAMTDTRLLVDEPREMDR